MLLRTLEISFGEAVLDEATDFTVDLLAFRRSGEADVSGSIKQMQLRRYPNGPQRSMHADSIREEKVAGS